MSEESKLPRIKFCHRCHQRVDNPFVGMNIKVAGGRLVSTCRCKATIIWKDKSPEKQPEPVGAAK